MNSEPRYGVVRRACCGTIERVDSVWLTEEEARTRQARLPRSGLWRIVSMPPDTPLRRPAARPTVLK